VRPARGERSGVPSAGRVVAAFGRRFLVDADDGASVACVVRGRRAQIACGDRVAFTATSPDEGVIESVEPRESLLYRSDAHREKLIAANVTQVIAVVATHPPPREMLLDRCLVAAEVAGARAVIVLNKVDLANDRGRAFDALAVYRPLGYPLVPLAAREGVGPLAPHLEGQTSVLIGASGVGKSTIVNALLPAAGARTAEAAAERLRGRHTTTHARLYRLDATSGLIDSPGLERFGLAHVAPEALAHAFVEFRPLLGHCRFSDCRHLAEPDCAITRAVGEGAIAAERLRSYRSLLAEVHRP